MLVKENNSNRIKAGYKQTQHGNQQT